MKTTAQHDRTRALALVLALVLFAGAGWLYHRHSYPNPWDHNEGVYFNSARLLSQGEPLFTSVFSSQPPVFLATLAWHFYVFGDNSPSGRVFMAGWGVAALLAMAFLSWRLFSAGTAAWTVFIAASAFLFFRAGHTAEAEMPAVALALVSMGLCLSSSRRDSLTLATCAGAVFALAFMTKVLVVPWLAAAAVLLLPASEGSIEWRRVWSRRCMARFLSFGVAFAVVGLVLFAVFDAREMWRQAFFFHFDKRETTGEAVPAVANLAHMVRYLGRDVGIAILALVGVAATLRSGGLALVWWAVLAASSLAFLLVHTPMAPNHVLLLGVCLAFAAAVGARAVTSLLSQKLPVMAAIIVVALLSQVCVEASMRGVPLGPGGVLTLNMLRNHTKFPNASIPAQDQQIIDYLRENTDSDESVVSDGHRAVFWSGRASPPFLCDITHERVVSGWLRDEDLIKHSTGVSTIIVQTGQLSRFPAFMQWVSGNYDVVAEIPGGSRSATIWRKLEEGKR
jgi:4-amino-4-deoxy-L-arabinose transferase-like glycosyltransferase